MGLVGLLVLGAAAAREEPVDEHLVLLAQVARVRVNYDAVLGVCRFVEPNDPFGSAINDVPALGAVADYLKQSHDVPLTGVRVVLLNPPNHGIIRLDPMDTNAAHHYFPSSEYRGIDRVIFDVDANGKRFKVIYTVFVVENLDHVSPTARRLCPSPGVGYRISHLLE